MLNNLLLVAIGGMAGTLCRYGMGMWVGWFLNSENVSDAGERGGGAVFPWGTLVVNLVGCFLFGLIAEWIAERANLREAGHLLLLTGFMGAFTTFSTFGHETMAMLRGGHYVHFAMNVLAHNVLGIVMVGLGIACAIGLRRLA